MKNKSGFLTLCFSFVPGAGQMYQGYMRRAEPCLRLLCRCAFAAVISKKPLFFRCFISEKQGLLLYAGFSRGIIPDTPFLHTPM